MIFNDFCLILIVFSLIIHYIKSLIHRIERIVLGRKAYKWILRDWLILSDLSNARNMLETGEMFYMQRGTPNYMFQFPVYPSLLFGIYKLFGYNQLYGIVFNLLMISIISFLLFEIFIYASSTLGLKPGVIKTELIALLTVLSFLFHPFISLYSMFKVHPFVIDMFFPIAIIFFSFRYLKLQSWKNLCLLAFSTGLGVLNRSTAFSAFIPFIILAASFLTLRKTL